MLDVVKDQFKTTIQKLEKLLRTENKRFEDLHQRTLENVAKMKVQVSMEKQKKTDGRSAQDKAKSALTAAQKTLDSALQEWDDLKSTTCKEAGVSYEQRVAARDAEISALKEAIKVL